MYRLHRKLAPAIALCLTILIIAGCGGTATKPEATAQTATAGKQVTLNLLGFPGVSTEALQDINDEFVKKNPNVKIKIKDSQGLQLFSAGAINDKALDGIDILLAPNNQVTQLASAKAVKDLSAVKVPKMNDLIAGFYDDLGQVDGKRYGLAITVSAGMVLVSQEQLTKAGVKMPSVDWTWQDFEQIMTATKNAGITNQVEVNALLDPLVRSYGGLIYDTDKKAWAFDSPEAKQALTFLAGMTSKELIRVQDGGGFRIGGPSGSPNSQQNLPAVSAFGGGGFGGGDRFMQSNNFTVQPYPRGAKGRFTPVSGTLAAVSASSTNPEMATEYVKFMVSATAQQILAKTGSYPVIADTKALAAWQERVGDARAKATEAALQGAYINTSPGFMELITGLTPYFTGKASLDPTISSLISTLK